MRSIWSDFELPRHPLLRGDIKTDVLIIGGGMAGLLTAHFLTEAGVRCIVAEANRVAGGITKNTTAKNKYKKYNAKNSIVLIISEIKPLAMQVRNEELLALRIDIKYSPMLELYLRTQN